MTRAGITDEGLARHLGKSVILIKRQKRARGMIELPDRRILGFYPYGFVVYPEWDFGETSSVDVGDIVVISGAKGRRKLKDPKKKRIDTGYVYTGLAYDEEVIEATNKRLSR